MKNIIINVFKTLFFFDLAVLIFTKLPEISGANPAISKLKQEALIMAVPLVLTLVYFFIVERRKLGVPINKRIFKAFGWGILGGILPLGTVIGTMVILKNLKFTGIEKVEHIYLWLAAILINAIAAELLLRGYLFNLFKKHYGFMFSAVVTTMLFVSLDIKLLDQSKIYIANIILLNFLLCLILEFSSSIISTVTARFFYTAVSCFMFGSMRLTGGYPTMLKFDISGKKLLIGGEYGFEGSVITLVALSLFAVILLMCKYHPLKKLKNKLKKRKFKKKVKSKKALDNAVAT